MDKFEDRDVVLALKRLAEKQEKYNRTHGTNTKIKAAEDLKIIERIEDGEVKRTFLVDVGDMPPLEAKEALAKIMSEKLDEKQAELAAKYENATDESTADFVRGVAAAQARVELLKETNADSADVEYFEKLEAMAEERLETALEAKEEFPPITGSFSEEALAIVAAIPAEPAAEAPAAPKKKRKK